MTSYAFDSDGVSYILTREGNLQNLVKISKIVINGNDYELTPFISFTYLSPGVYFHNPLYIIDGYFFTNNGYFLKIFDKNGNPVKHVEVLHYQELRKQSSDRLKYWIPWTGAQIGGSTVYAKFATAGWFSYSVQDGNLALTLSVFVTLLETC